MVMVVVEVMTVSMTNDHYDDDDLDDADGSD